MNQRKTFAAFVMALFFAAFFYFYKENKTVVGHPKILIAKNDAYAFYSKSDLERLSKNLSDQGFQTSEDFSEMPFVEKAILSKSLVGPSHITVFLQEPIVAFSVNGLYKLVDKQGEVFSEVPQYKIPNLPIISGAKFLAKKNRFKALTVYLKLEKEGLLSRDTLSEILMNEELVFVFSGVNGKVLIGEKDFIKRIDRLSKVIKYLRFHGLEAEILDARFKDRVVVSLNKKKSV